MFVLGVPASDGSESVREYAKKAFFTGLTITIPFFVTVFVLFFAFDFLSGLVDPLVVVLQSALGVNTEPAYLAELVTLFVLGGVIFLIGVTAESGHGSGRVERRFEGVMAELPGIGSLYQRIDEISDLVFSGDTASFREVKLVEYPREESYALAFVTAETPEVVTEATGHDEMVSLFMPMAPNPVMGGFVVHIPADRVYDIDMTVEEGVTAILSSGVAVNEPSEVSSPDVGGDVQSGGDTQ